MTVAPDPDSARPDWIDALSPALAPPADLEDRVVAGLRERGWIRRGRRRWVDGVAAVALLALGTGLGAAWSRPAADPRPAYVLLLYPGSTRALDPQAEAETAGSYRAWAGRLRAEGHAISGERLADGAETVPEAASGPDGAALQGFFVVSAASAAEAAQIARASPHVLRGGTVVVRAIDAPR